jgi:hypothetical protein
MFNFGSAGAISFDMCQQTEYGTLRSYVDMGVQTNSNTGGYGGPNVLNPLFPSASLATATRSPMRTAPSFSSPASRRAASGRSSTW